MELRFFLRIILGVLALNLYAKGQVENVKPLVPSPSTVNEEGDAPARDPKDLQENGTTRDPFWPVGYSPAVEVAEAPSSAAAEEPVDETGGHVDFSGLSKEEQAVIKSKMVVGGILTQGTTCLAIINQQLVKEGEELSLTEGEKTYQFGVKKLTPEKILLESMQDE